MKRETTVFQSVKENNNKEDKDKGKRIAATIFLILLALAYGYFVLLGTYGENGIYYYTIRHGIGVVIMAYLNLYTLAYAKKLNAKGKLKMPSLVVSFGIFLLFFMFSISGLGRGIQDLGGETKIVSLKDCHTETVTRRKSANKYYIIGYNESGESKKYDITGVPYALRTVAMQAKTDVEFEYYPHSGILKRFEIVSEYENTEQQLANDIDQIVSGIANRVNETDELIEGDLKITRWNGNDLGEMEAPESMQIIILRYKDEILNTETYPIKTIEKLFYEEGDFNEDGATDVCVHLVNQEGVETTYTYLYDAVSAPPRKYIKSEE